MLGYDERRKVKNIVLEGLKNNGRAICDTMKGKPGYYKTADVWGRYVSDLVDGLVFRP